MTATVSDEFADHVLHKYKNTVFATGKILDNLDPDQFIRSDNGLLYYFDGALLRMFSSLPTGAICGYLRFLMCCLRKTQMMDDSSDDTRIDLEDSDTVTAMLASLRYYFS